jgi:hypothetical protein
LERLPRLRAILDEMGRAPAVKTTIVALIDGRKARPRTLLLLLLKLWCWWSVKSCLLGWSGYPSAGKLPRGGARGALLGTNRYLDGCVVEGPVGVFLFFSALWAEMQSS